eukprot:3310606-Rhodomonas_salina.1
MRRRRGVLVELGVEITQRVPHLVVDQVDIGVEVILNVGGGGRVRECRRTQDEEEPILHSQAREHFRGGVRTGCNSVFAAASANQTLGPRCIKGVSSARRSMRRLVCAMVAAAVAARVGAQTVRGDLLARQDMFMRVKSMQMQLAEMQASLSDVGEEGSRWDPDRLVSDDEEAAVSPGGT